MTIVTEYQQQIDQFEAHYHYDCSYMRELLASSTTAYQCFADFLPLARFREKLSVTDYWIAKISAAQVVDCGACFELNIKMALEEGCDPALLGNLIESPQQLAEPYQTIRHYAHAIAAQTNVGEPVFSVMHARYDRGQLLEFGLCIASATVFPAIKRAIAAAESCSVFDVQRFFTATV